MGHARSAAGGGPLPRLPTIPQVPAASYDAASRMIRPARLALPVPLLLAALAGTAVPAVALADGATVTAATPQQKSKAQQLFAQGKRELDAGRPKAAHDLFRRSYAVVASPNSHLFVARCLVALDRPAEAWTEYEAVVGEARRVGAKDKKYKATHDAAEAERDALRPSIGLLRVHVAELPDLATVEVEGREVPPSALAKGIAVAPGSVKIVVKVPDAAPVERSVQLAAGGEKTVSLELAKPLAEEPAPAAETESHPWRVAMWTSGVVGVAGIATWAIAASMSRSQLNELNAECTAQTPCDPVRELDYDRARSNQRLANVGLGVGLGAIGVGVVSFFLDRAGAPSHDKEKDDATRVRAQVAAGPSWIGVAGSF